MSLTACQLLNYVLSYPVPSLFSTTRATVNTSGMTYSKAQRARASRDVTHHFEVFRSTRLPPEVAREKHVSDVVARSIIELEHVKRPRLKVLEVSFDLQSL